MPGGFKSKKSKHGRYAASCRLDRQPADEIMQMIGSDMLDMLYDLNDTHPEPTEAEPKGASASWRVKRDEDKPQPASQANPKKPNRKRSRSAANELCFEPCGSPFCELCGVAMVDVLTGQSVE